MPGFSLLGSLPCSPPLIWQGSLPNIRAPHPHTDAAPLSITKLSLQKHATAGSAGGWTTTPRWSLESGTLGPRLGNMSDLDFPPPNNPLEWVDFTCQRPARHYSAGAFSSPQAPLRSAPSDVSALIPGLSDPWVSTFCPRPLPQCSIYG